MLVKGSSGAKLSETRNGSDVKRKLPAQPGKTKDLMSVFKNGKKKKMISKIKTTERAMSKIKFHTQSLFLHLYPYFSS